MKIKRPYTVKVTAKQIQIYNQSNKYINKDEENNKSHKGPIKTTATGNAKTDAIYFAHEHEAEKLVHGL